MNYRSTRVITGLFASLALTGALRAQDEFVGPFGSWANVRTSYGARGDGAADDTAALQRALDEVGNSGKSSVVYLPAGTYRITGTLNLRYKINVAFIGEHPSNTIIRWDGPSGGTMMVANGVTLSRWGRITWEGSGRAGAGVAHQWDRAAPYAPTNLEHADEVFKDMSKGLIGGVWGGHNDAEVAIHRAKFIRCSQAGISIESFNALDYWIWDSEFVDNARGITNEFGAGNFMVYRSLFRNSSLADITMGNTQFFTFRGNTSIGSRRFLQTSNPGQNAARITIQENRILDTLDPLSIEVCNLGPVILLDNQIRSTGTAGPVVKVQSWANGGDLVSVGNKYTVSNALAVDTANPRMWTLDDAVVGRDQIDGTIPALPAVAANRGRRVFEVAPGSTSAAIQSAINQAAQLAGQKPVVHMARGDYPISQTILVPAGADVQIVGDGHGTNVRWTGASGGTMFQLPGPSRATFRELQLNGNGIANAIVIENADQPGARIHGDGLYQEYARQHNILADRISIANVNLQNHQANHNGGVGIKVIGNGGTSRVGIFGGVIGAAATGEFPIYDVASGGRLYVQDVWYEGPTARVAYLRDSGTFTYHGGHLAPSTSSPDVPVIEMNGFSGRATIMGMTMDLKSPNRRIQVTNETASTDVLVLGLESDQPNYFARLGSGGRAALQTSRQYSSSGSLQVADSGTARTADFIRAALDQTRTVKPIPLADLPGGVTDVRMFRIAIGNPVIGVHIKGGTTAVTNQPPAVSAGADQNITLGATATLNGSAADDGLPSNTLRSTWTQVSGPGTATFGDPGRPVTTASFPAAGTYVLRLTATDSALSAGDDVVVTVTSPSGGTGSGGTAAGIRVNAGGASYTDPQGRIWSADTGCSTGATFATSNAIAGTTTPALYQSERWGGGTFSYQFAVANGAYNVTLKFAEIYFTQAGQRVFNVAINGQTVLSNFDVVAAAGGAFTAVDRTVPVNVTGGQIAIQFTGVVDNAKISAIEIVPTAVAVALTPGTATLGAAQSRQFTAAVTGTPNTGVTWSLSPAVGTISASGLYSAPATITAAQTVTVRATSAADPTKFATATVSLVATPAFTPIRVNAGGPAYTDPQGRVWSADRGFSNGATYSTAKPVSGTTTPALYQSERWNSGSFQYDFAVANGTRAVTLKFAEIYHAKAGDRVFNVTINGQTVLSRFDAVAAAGGAFRPVDRTFSVPVTNGRVTILFTGVVENPKVNAIEIQ